jgi:predicted transcriptional regulator
MATFDQLKRLEELAQLVRACERKVSEFEKARGFVKTIQLQFGSGNRVTTDLELNMCSGNADMTGRKIMETAADKAFDILKAAAIEELEAAKAAFEAVEIREGGTK